MTAEEDWRRLAKQVTTETDPMRLMDLLDKLIRALDARRKTLAMEHRELHDTSESSDTSGQASE